MSRLGGFLVVAALARCLSASAEPTTDPWAEILRARVNEKGEVAYRSIERIDRARLDEALRRLASVEPEKLDHDRAVAFWLNAYHTMIVAAVLRGESPETVASRARMYHWFGQRVGGARRTLDDVRAILGRYASADPRIHLAISNGTRGGPALATEAYVEDRLDSQLAAAARRFVNDPERYAANPAKRRLEVSRLFAWYQDDFDHEAGSLAEFLRPLATRDDLLEVLSVPELEVRYRTFDWRLNVQPDERPK